MNPARLLAASAVIGLWAFSAVAADLRPEDAVRHIGETATVCDVVASAMFEANVPDQLTLLDLGEPSSRSKIPDSHRWDSSLKIRFEPDSPSRHALIHSRARRGIILAESAGTTLAATEIKALAEEIRGA